MAEETTKTLTIDDLKAHSSAEDLYLLISGKVYNVSKFMDEHPGGDEVLISEAARDATEAFEDVGHSDDAREILKTLYVGDYKGDEFGKAHAVKPSSTSNSASASSNFVYLVPLAALVAYFAYHFYTTSQ